MGFWNVKKRRWESDGTQMLGLVFALVGLVVTAAIGSGVYRFLQAIAVDPM